jgi:hypothetical protein
MYMGLMILSRQKYMQQNPLGLGLSAIDVEMAIEKL